MLPTRPVTMLLAVLLTLMLTSACLHGNSLARANGGIRGVEVTGAVGAQPHIEIDTPLQVDETLIRIVEKGDGPPVRLDQVFVIQLTIVNGRSGATAVSTYDKGQRPMAVTDSDATLFPVLTRALVGQPQGTRVVVAATPEDTYGEAGAPQYDVRKGDPLVLVADVIAVPATRLLEGPEGTPAPARKGVPRVAELNGLPTGILFGLNGRTLPRPDRLVVVPLIEGEGPVVDDRDLVTIDYLGQVWGSSRQFANTFTGEPVTVALGADRVIPAWEETLPGLREGSRVLVLTPPRLAFAATGNPPDIPGDAALAYVIDVLGAS